MKKLLSILLSSLLALSLFSGSAQAESASFSNYDLNASFDCLTTQLTFNGETEDYTISTAGTYLLSGTLNATLYVEVTSDEKVQLVFNGITINSTDGPAVYVKQADKVVITLVEGSENTINDGSNYALDAEGANAAIYSKDDLTINGTGGLVVNGNTAHGIVSNDDLAIVSGNITVNAVSDTLKGKDSVKIKDGTLVLSAGEDAIVASNTGENYGDVYIEGGNITINAGDKGIEAAHDVVINGGTINILSAVEGIEGFTVTMNAGTVTINASDDGINATNSSASTSNNEEVQEGVHITINGGDLTVVVTSDTLDSNGIITINGGNVNLTIKSLSGGNGTLDANGAVTINGGNVVTNDGGISNQKRR